MLKYIKIKFIPNYFDCTGVCWKSNLTEDIYFYSIKKYLHKWEVEKWKEGTLQHYTWKWLNYLNSVFYKSITSNLIPIEYSRYMYSQTL